MSDRNIDAYRVGILAALHFDVRALILAGRRPVRTVYEVKQLIWFAHKGNWRAVRLAFDGWHAEHAYARVNAGKGWTRKRALADLRRQLERAS